MSETFKYPNATSPTKTLTFQSESGGSDGHMISDGESLEYNQIADHTLGGIPMVRNLGAPFRRWQYTVIVRITSVSYTDKDDVIEFFSSTYADGGEKTFVWTDYASVARTVRMIGGLTIKTISGTHCEVNMNLELENT